MRLTKGKQKIVMKKVEAYADRMITFSKRKSGISKKINEIVSLCNVETIFLVFSESGKPYTFAYPSLKEALGGFENPLSHEPFASINVGPLVEAYKREKIQVLMQRYVDLVEELEIQNEKEKILKKSEKENKEKMWWITPTEGLSVKEKMCRRQTFLDLHVSLSDMDGEGIF
ncbi:AGAMOUS-like 57 [Raphanus sativus]|uniref:Agamous-like MADS-box protein AGL23 n=1 Tax=Raphanus sativus TaxID=3726 RepID=A0A6J0JB73_RAPSA|nr:agamous-like MADS-box protein AGL23 [Raphanus sativus]KAJ4892846.1 AGAMOUS-like 57 [Raphanus sativus]